MKRLERLTALLSLLQSRKYTRIVEIENRFGISERTAFRDLRALEESGVPLSFEKNRGYFIVDGHFLPPMAFTQDEAKSFVFVEQLAKKYIDAETYQHFASGLEKIKNKLKDAELSTVEHLESRVGAYINPNFTPQYLHKVEQACSNKEGLKIIYQDFAGNETIREVEPIGITFYSQAWHMIAYCKLRKSYRDFSLARILRLESTAQPFSREHISLSDYIQQLETAD